MRKFSKAPKSSINASYSIDRFWEMYNDLDDDDMVDFDDAFEEEFPGVTESRHNVTDEAAQWGIDYIEAHYPQRLSYEDVLETVMEALYDAGLRARTFEEAGVLTMNKGFVLTIDDEEYQFEMLGSY